MLSQNSTKTTAQNSCFSFLYAWEKRTYIISTHYWGRLTDHLENYYLQACQFGLVDSLVSWRPHVYTLSDLQYLFPLPATFNNNLCQAYALRNFIRDEEDAGPCSQTRRTPLSVATLRKAIIALRMSSVTKAAAPAAASVEQRTLPLL